MPNDIRDPRPASPWRRTADAREIVATFLVALRSRDILPPVNLQADGQLHRCDAAGRNGRGDAAYLLHLDGVPAGGFENWRDGLGWQTWRFEQGSPLDPWEREALRLRSEAARLQRDSATAQRQAEAALLAVRIWNSARVAPDDHPYLLFKGVQAYGLRVYKGALVVPVRNSAGLLTSLQFDLPYRFRATDSWKTARLGSWC